MNSKGSLLTPSRRNLTLMVAVVWIVAVAVSLAWNWRQAGDSVLVLAESEGQASFQKDVIYRKWSTLHGGVYVPPTETSPPNPYLAHLPDRDVTTSAGMKLTLVNPAYMTRQVHELGFDEYGLLGHITSLDPLRPENAADEWETKAMLAFRDGAPKASSVETIDGRPYFRFMRPLFTEAGCLRCHVDQGYKIGDIHGGISVSLPLAPFLAVAGQQRMLLALGHAVIGFLGLLGIWTGNRLLGNSERGLRERERLLSKVFEILPVGLWIADDKGKLLQGNPAGVAIWDAEPLVEQKQYDVFKAKRLPSGEAIAENDWALAHTVNKGVTIVDELLEIETFEGKKKIILNFTAPVLNDQGQVAAAIVVNQNITERTQAEQALIQAKDQAEAANRAKSEFLANMSHELRTPFNGIMGMLQLLRTSKLDKEQHQYISMALQASDRYTRLLSDLLDISGLENGGTENRLEEFSVHDSVAAVFDLFPTTVRKNDVAMEYHIDPALPERLIGDPTRLRQILFNLVGNALKFTDQGRIGLKVWPLKSANGEQNGPRILFCVTDTGIGIPEDKLAMLFKPFTQVDGSYTRKYQGAGLGLAIVKRLVDSMGGYISVDSTVGEGTTVYAVLTFTSPDQNPIDPVSEKP